MGAMATKVLSVLTQQDSRVISELRIDVGAGYRVYYTHVGNMVILLTSGGDKKSQSRDIERAIRLLRDWEKRNG